MGNDVVVTTAALGGIGSLFELNVAMPVMIDAFLESVKLLANVTNVFVDKLLTGLDVNEERCRAVDRSIADDGHVARAEDRLRARRPRSPRKRSTAARRFASCAASGKCCPTRSSTMRSIHGR